MYDFDLLEKRCKRYHLKKYFLILLPFVVFILAIVSYIVFFHKVQAISPIQKSKVEKQVSKHAVIKKKKVPISSSLSKNIGSNKCYSLQFFVATEAGIMYLHFKEEKLKQLGFDCYIHKEMSLLHLQCNDTEDKNNLLASKELANKYKLNFIIKRVPCMHKKEKLKKSKKITKAEIVTKVDSPVEVKDTFILQSQKFNVANLKKLFQQRQSYNLALKIARFYYNAKDYTNAIEWAKKSNSIDKTDATSWIIYAKSLYNLGNKEKAKKILHIYLQFENSKQVNEILSNWSNK